MKNATSFVAAAVQFAPAFLDREATIQKAVEAIDEASSHDAKLIVFPEVWIPGYPVWIYGAAGWEDPQSKRVFAQLQENAVEISSSSSSSLGRICERARQRGVTVVVGVNERDTRYSRGSLFNSIVYISDRGEISAVHRKLMPTHAERIIWGQGDGSGLHVIDTPVGRLGGLVCWEHWMPLARFAMHAKGEQVHAALWPDDMPENSQLASRSYAYEGRCFVIAAGAVLTMHDIPDDFELKDAISPGDDGVILSGGSGIIGPDSEWVSGPVTGEEVIVYGEVDLRRIAEEQQSLDVCGHYNRPDIFRLTVDQSRHTQVDWVSEAAASVPVDASTNKQTNGGGSRPCRMR